MCDNCTGGLTSLDNGYGQPIHCERCTVGLDLAMTSVARHMMDIVENEQVRVDRTARLTDPFSLACGEAAEQQLAASTAEHDRLEVIYLALGGHSATAAARLERHMSLVETLADAYENEAIIVSMEELEAVYGDDVFEAMAAAR